LADLLGRVIDEYEKHHPSVSPAEVREALSMAAQASAPGDPRAAAALISAVTVLLIGAFMYMALRGGDPPEAVPLIAGIAAIIAVAFVLKQRVRRR
jgi:hypothetical protein